jgi:hypothetical protein
MTISDIFNDKTLKPKQKTAWIREHLFNKTLKSSDVILFAQVQKDPVKATCMESLEYFTQKNPELATAEVFDFACQHLSAIAPRIKWESARVVGNTAHLFLKKLDNALHALIENTNHEGTVVRWSAAFALSKILLLKTSHNKDLIPLAEQIIEKEEKNSIRKIYADALKKLKN